MIYLDAAATTFPKEAALQAFLSEARAGANPSSLHRAGFAAHTRLQAFRETLAKTVSCAPEELFFTSGGTESANLAIFGAVRARRRRGNTILLSDAEHPCVEEAVKRLEEDGFCAVRIPTRGGELDFEVLERAATEDVICAAFMHVNNETGAVFPVRRAFEIVRKHSKHAVCFSDCVQSYLHEKVDFDSLGADLFSVSAHKIGGVRGVGMLCCKKGVRLTAHLLGGGQEAGLRSGTENTPGIAAFAAAAEDGFLHFDERCARMARLRDSFSEMLSTLPTVRVLSVPRAANHIVSASFAGEKSEVLLHRLSDAGICVSAGSACSSKSRTRSRVLLAFGLSLQQADESLRFSFDDQTSTDDLQNAFDALNMILQNKKGNAV